MKPSETPARMAAFEAAFARASAQGLYAPGGKGMVKAVVKEFPWRYSAALEFNGNAAAGDEERRWWQFLRVGGWKYSDWVRKTDFSNGGGVRFRALLGASLWRGADRFSAEWWRSNVAACEICALPPTKPEGKAAAADFVSGIKTAEDDRSLAFGGVLNRGFRAKVGAK